MCEIKLAPLNGPGEGEMCCNGMRAGVAMEVVDDDGVTVVVHGGEGSAAVFFRRVVRVDVSHDLGGGDRGKSELLGRNGAKRECWKWYV